jgi:hypothetical protein
MNEDERRQIEADATAKAFKDANLEHRLKSVEDAISSIEGAVKWFFRALWGGVAYLLTQVAQWLLGGGWPK